MVLILFVIGRLEGKTKKRKNQFMEGAAGVKQIAEKWVNRAED
jgi:hypothetical protein